MSFAACAEITRKGDPDRFLATMTAPEKMRGPLFAIYAFNVEVSRAAWVSAEPRINEIRLQWWQDALDEISSGQTERRHEVATPLAVVISPEIATVLGQLVQARKWDIYADPFGSQAMFSQYLDATAGGLMWAAAAAIGVTEGQAAIRDMGYAGGLANWLKAVPDLLARGRQPLLDASDEALRDLARGGLARLNAGRKLMPRDARYATRAGWQTNKTLCSVVANPAAVTGGRLHSSEFARRASLLWHVASGGE